jgi:hypothetical protein
VRLLDSGIIYPISDSKWVSPAHCIPKHVGLAIIKNKMSYGIKCVRTIGN